jgi:Tol biopolymer transport system component
VIRLTLAVLCSLCAVAAAGCSRGGDRGDAIAFVSTRGGDYALYGMNADGGDEGRISDEHGDAETSEGLLFELDPAWSPDGTKIAFISKRSGSLDIYVMDADGSNVTRLTKTKENDSHPTWSPDGKRIAFARDERIYVMQADGTGSRRLTTTLAPEIEPAWSPDGASIAYTRRIPGTNIREIWISPATGGSARKVTSTNAQNYTPAWSPDGNTLAFSSDRDGGRYAIFRIGVDGKGLSRVTRRSIDDAFEPSWSRDGSLIAYSRGGAIFTIDESGQETALTDPADNDSSPVWNPRPSEEKES